MAFAAVLIPARAGELPEPLEGWDLPPAQKVALLEKRLHETHDIDGMILSVVDVYTRPDGSTYTVPGYGDSDYWTGNYLVGESLRYAVTGDPEAKANCERSVRALIRLARKSGKRGVIIRGYMDASMSDKYLLQEDDEYVNKSPDGSMYLSLDASADQLVGAMQGFHFVYRYVADEQLKKEISEVVGEICDGLIENNYNLVDIDGKPTTWGEFAPGRIPSELHALLILTVFKVGYYITGNPRYEDAYNFLREKAGYGKMSRRAKFLPGQNYSDDAMEFVCYLNILMVEDDPAARADYLASMRRTWKVVKYHDKAYFNIIVLHYIDDLPDREEALRRALEQIRIFPTEKVARTVDFCSYKRSDPKYPNPANYRPVENYYWIGDISGCSSTVEAGDRILSSGVDYILLYWLARYWGFLEQ